MIVTRKFEILHSCFTRSSHHPLQSTFVLVPSSYRRLSMEQTEKVMGITDMSNKIKVKKRFYFLDPSSLLSSTSRMVSRLVKKGIWKSFFLRVETHVCWRGRSRRPWVSRTLRTAAGSPRRGRPPPLGRPGTVTCPEQSKVSGISLIHWLRQSITEWISI